MELRNKKPVLSVVMPVHNAAPYLSESIGSIRNQTLGDFEFIILDDASTDGSNALLREWEQKDPRIRLFANSARLGLAGSSNFVVAHASAPIIARMDADDISHPDRLSRQWRILKDHADVVAVGTLFDGIDAAGRRTRPRDRWRLVRRSPYIPFPHGSVMFRKEAFNSVGGYSSELLLGEDQSFFRALSTTGRIVTLADVLYHFRFHTTNTTLRTDARSIAKTQNGNGWKHDGLAALYLKGAMRLWSGQAPEVLADLRHLQQSHWTARFLATLGWASLGSISPTMLRLVLRWLISARDGLAGLKIKEGRTYEWPLK